MSLPLMSNYANFVDPGRRDTAAVRKATAYYRKRKQRCPPKPGKMAAENIRKNENALIQNYLPIHQSRH
jgi:hypothetical protein